MSKSVSMFRAECFCKKFCVVRPRWVISWINRKCKSCKSNLKVYCNDVLIHDYSIKFESRFEPYKIIKPISMIKKDVFLPSFEYKDDEELYEVKVKVEYNEVEEIKSELEPLFNF